MRTPKTAVISGASSGIGLETARLFLQNGWTVYGLCRSKPVLPGLRHIPCDLTDDAAVLRAFGEIGAQEGKIGVLVNGAGFGIAGAAELTATEDIAAQFDLNFLGVARCVKAAVPLMREMGGVIVNIGSLAALFPIAFQSFYSASKAALSAFTMALRTELRPFGIAVCCVLPGDVRTGFTDARKTSLAGGELYGGRIERSVAVMERDERRGLPPAAVAKLIHKAACKARPAPFTITGFGYKLLALLDRLLPKRLVSFILTKLYGGG